MHRIDNSCFLLYIEPRKEEKLITPINDEITKIMQLALSEAQIGVGNYSNVNAPPDFSPNVYYKGIHHSGDGEPSSNNDYLLKNGMITNSLAPYYLAYYRNSIPPSEMAKVNSLVQYYRNNQKKKIYKDDFC